MILLDIVHSTWKDFIKANLYLIENFNIDILTNCRYYPEPINIFKVFETPLDKIEIVILGEEPYYLPNMSIGRAYAVKEGKELTVALKNISKQITEENVSLFYQPKSWQTLGHWKDQGIFLLNTALTVEAGKPRSHLKYWRKFIEKVIIHISINNPCIWLMWGDIPQTFIPQVKGKTLHVMGYDKDSILDIPKDDKMNYILIASSPDKEEFIGCNHFYYTNIILTGNKKFPIQW